MSSVFDIAARLLLAAEAPQRLPILPMFLVIGVLFYLMILGPERRKRAEHQQLLDSLKKNDRVVTIGGIFGTVVNVHETEVTLRVDETTNARIRVLRSAISRVENDKDKDKEKDKDKKDEKD